MHCIQLISYHCIWSKGTNNLIHYNQKMFITWYDINRFHCIHVFIISVIHGPLVRFDMVKYFHDTCELEPYGFDDMLYMQMYVF